MGRFEVKTATKAEPVSWSSKEGSTGFLKDWQVIISS